MRRNRLLVLALGGVGVLALIIVIAAISAGGGGDDTSGEGASARSAPVRQDVTIGLAGEPSSFDVSIVEDGIMQSIARNIFEGLTARNNKMEVQPELATSWEQTGPTTWELKLREGVTFHNGEPFDAEAAAFSIERVLDPDNESALTSFIPTIKSVEAVDPTTLTIETKGPDPNILGALTYIMMVPPKAVEADTEGFARKPIGTGPYKFVEWAPGQGIELTAYENYWGDQPAIKNVKAVFRAEPQVRLAALKAGEIDVAAIDPDQAKNVPRLTATQSTDVAEFGFDAQEGRILSDQRLRLAINHAINRQQLIDVVFQGHAQPANGQLVPPQSIGYNEQLKDYPYDLEKAKQLVAEAGAEGKKVVLVASQGRWPQDTETVDALAAMIEETGLDVEVERMEFSQFLERVFDRKARADLMYFAASSDTFDSARTISTLLLSEKNGGVLTRYENPKIDEMLEDAVAAETLEEKEEIYHQLWQEAYDDVAMIPVVGLENTYGTAKDLVWEARADNRINAAEMKFQAPES